MNEVLNKFPIMHLIGSTKIENEQQFIDAEKYYTKNGYIVFVNTIELFYLKEIKISLDIHQKMMFIIIAMLLKQKIF